MLLQTMRSERNRLSSFANWTNPNVTPEILARSGFFFIEIDDIVLCPFCKVYAGGWLPTTLLGPWSLHRTFSPRCPLVTGLLCFNVPIDASSQPIWDLGRTFREYELYEIRPRSATDVEPLSLRALGMELHHPSDPNDPSETPPPSPEYVGVEPPPPPSPEPPPPEAADEPDDTQEFQEEYILNKCTVCLNDRLQIVCLPCGHFCVCAACVKKLSRCAICRTHIRALVKVYTP